MRFKSIAGGIPLPPAILLWTAVFTTAFLFPHFVFSDVSARWLTPTFWLYVLVNLPWATVLAVPMGLQVAVMNHNALTDGPLRSRLRTALSWGAAAAVLVFVGAAVVVPRANTAVVRLRYELHDQTVPADRLPSDRELALGQLRTRIRRAESSAQQGPSPASLWLKPNALRVELAKKFSIPLLCVFTAFASAALGTLLAGTGRYRVPLLVLMNGMLFFVCWVLLVVGEQYGDAGTLPPMLVMMLPNVALAVLGGAALVRALQTPSQGSTGGST